MNADDIEQEIRNSGLLRLTSFHVEASEQEWIDFATESALFTRFKLTSDALEVRLSNQVLSFENVVINSYIAAGVAGFLRSKLLDTNQSFTFETVISSDDKVRLLEDAQKLGFRTYLYYIATNDPEVNVARVQQRVDNGGHDVPHDTIVKRYWRSTALLKYALKFSNRAYIFDNSDEAPQLVVEATGGLEAKPLVSKLPGWINLGDS